jgi:hypothetical protein
MEICVKRHKKSNSHEKYRAAEFWVCMDCEQGKKNMQILYNGVSIPMDIVFEQPSIEASH